MIGIAAALRQRWKRCAHGDAGFTMIEVVVVMVIMSVVLVIFTSGITQAFSAENKVDTSVNAEAQLVTAFQRLDREVRYASAVSTAGTVSGDPTVEFLTTFTGTSTCTQLRIHASNGELQQRTWTSNGGALPINPTAWQQLASNISGTTPFIVSQADATFSFQRLEIVVTATFGVNSNASAKQSDITFVALNTTYDPTASYPNATTCTEGRGVSW